MAPSHRPSPPTRRARDISRASPSPQPGSQVERARRRPSIQRPRHASFGSPMRRERHRRLYVPRRNRVLGRAVAHKPPGEPFPIVASNVAKRILHVGPRGVDGLHEPCDGRLVARTGSNDIVEIERAGLKRIRPSQFPHSSLAPVPGPHLRQHRRPVVERVEGIRPTATGVVARLLYQIAVEPHEIRPIAEVRQCQTILMARQRFRVLRVETAEVKEHQRPTVHLETRRPARQASVREVPGTPRCIPRV